MKRDPLKTLIVEDNPAKKRKLFERLQAIPDVFADPDVVGSTGEALKRIQEVEFDLVILDVVVPSRAHGEPDEQNALELLARIDSDVGMLKRPRHVLLISAAEGLSDAVTEWTRGRPWGCIRYTEESDQALLDIERIGSWIHERGLERGRSQSCDAFIVTALEEPEFAALENEVEAGPLEPLDESQLVRYVELQSGGRKIRVGMAFAPRMGPVASAVLCTKVIANCGPRLLVMAGICAGIGSAVDIGDVVAADASWDWQSGKFVSNQENDFQIAPHQINIPAAVRNLLIQLKRDEEFWTSFARDARAAGAKLPKLVLGPVATGASVVADERITRKIREEQNKNVVALDMETYAVYAAAASATYACGAISLKAVCDRGDKDKNDASQAYAAKVSARCAIRLLETLGDKLLALYDR